MRVKTEAIVSKRKEPGHAISATGEIESGRQDRFATKSSHRSTAGSASRVANQPLLPDKLRNLPTLHQSRMELPAVVPMQHAFSGSLMIPLGSLSCWTVRMASLNILRNMMIPLSDVTRCSKPCSAIGP